MVLTQEPVSGLSASNDGPTALGDVTTLSASVTAGSNVHYVWDLSDGGPLDDSGPVVSHIYSDVGTFTAVVTASNGVSNQSATTTVIIQDVPPVAGFSTSSPDVLGETTSFANESSGSNLSFEWDFGDGSPIATDVAPVHTYVTSGTFTVVLTAINSAGSNAVAAQVIIEVSPPDLRGHWTLDEASGQRQDSSDYGNHLADNNTVGSVVGQVGLAADFESDDSEYLSIGDTAQDGLDIAGSLTLVGWVNAERLDRHQIMAAKYEYGVNNRAYRFDLRPGNLLGLIVSPDGTYIRGEYLLEASPPFSLSPGTWYHVAGVFDAEQRTLSIYVDGELIGSRSVIYDTIHDSSAPFMLGAGMVNGQTTRHFDGQLDDWRVYSRALTGSEIEDLMAMPAP